MRSYFANISDRNVILILLGFFAGATTVAVFSHLHSSQVDWWAWADSFAQNFGTEMYGGFLTFLLIEVFVGSRQARQAKGEALQVEKDRLILQMGSPFNEPAVEAARQLSWRGWLEDGSLQGAFLDGANLQGAILLRASLQGASLFGANLQGAILALAYLQGAKLFSAKLQGAKLRGANLQEADLRVADLQGAVLDGAKLDRAKFDRNTMLPDGTKWTAETDMARFTDPDHPELWRSSDPGSPAYRGDDD